MSAPHDVGPTPVTALAAVLRAPNPGPMTLDGTRSWVLRAPGAREAVVVDPGPDDAGHLHALAAAGPVALVLVTHRHADHTAGVDRLHALTGAPVRAADPAWCRGAAPLRDGEVVGAAGVRAVVVGVPGHTADSVAFHLPDDAPRTAPGTTPGTGAGSVLTGDTILGRGTTVLAAPDGSLTDYLASLDRLEALGPALVLPAHGPVVDDLVAVVRAYRDHRLARLQEVRDVVAGLRGRTLAPADVDDALVGAVVDVVYADVDPAVRPAAAQSVRAQLAHLARRHPPVGTSGTGGGLSAG